MSLKKLIIEQEIDTPYVSFDPDTGYCEMNGKSYPEDIWPFYEPILEWFDEYAASKKSAITMNFKLEYYNTASSKKLLDLFYKFEGMIKDGINVTINWYYPNEDEDMLECGQGFEKIVSIPFRHIGYDDYDE